MGRSCGDESRKPLILVSQQCQRPFIMRSETDQILWRGLLKMLDIVLFPLPPCSQCVCGPDQSCVLYNWFNLNKTSCVIKQQSRVKKNVCRSFGVTIQRMQKKDFSSVLNVSGCNVLKYNIKTCWHKMNACEVLMAQMNCPPIRMQYVLLSSNQQAVLLTPFQSACSMFSCPPISMH